MKSSWPLPDVLTFRKVNPAQLAGHLCADLNSLQRLGRANGRNVDRNRLLLDVPGNDRNRSAPSASTPAAPGFARPGAAAGPLGRHGRGRRAVGSLLPRTGDERDTEDGENGGCFEVAWHSTDKEMMSTERRDGPNRLPQRDKPKSCGELPATCCRQPAPYAPSPSGSAVRRADAGQNPQFYDCRHPRPGARHRRQQRDVHAGQRAPAETADRQGG